MQCLFIHVLIVIYIIIITLHHIHLFVEEKMRKVLLIFIVILALVACTNDYIKNNEQKKGDIDTNMVLQYKTIELDDILNYVDDGYMIADVREVDEFNAGHIPGAINVPLSVLENSDFTLLDKDEKYIVVCRSGNRSMTASNILTEASFDVVNVREGMMSWTGEVEK